MQGLGAPAVAEPHAHGADLPARALHLGVAREPHRLRAVEEAADAGVARGLRGLHLRAGGGVRQCVDTKSVPGGRLVQLDVP